MHPHFGFSFVTPARELLWKVSSGPRSEKVARLWPKPCAKLQKLENCFGVILIKFKSRAHIFSRATSVAYGSPAKNAYKLMFLLYIEWAVVVSCSLYEVLLKYAIIWNDCA